MVIDLKPEQQRVIDLAIQSGAYHDSDEVIATALSMLAEDIEDGAVSEARRSKAHGRAPCLRALSIQRLEARFW